MVSLRGKRGHVHVGELREALSLGLVKPDEVTEKPFGWTVRESLSQQPRRDLVHDALTGDQFFLVAHVGVVCRPDLTLTNDPEQAGSVRIVKQRTAGNVIEARLVQLLLHLVE